MLCLFLMYALLFLCSTVLVKRDVYVYMYHNVLFVIVKLGIINYNEGINNPYSAAIDCRSQNLTFIVDPRTV